MMRFFSSDDAPVEPLPLPPIDAKAPAHLETATLAVG